MSTLAPLPLRIGPDADLRRALERVLAEHAAQAAFVVSGIGSLHAAALRTAGAAQARVLAGPLEIVTLAGTLSRDGAHLHACVADTHGAVTGGHVAYGCRVRTTAEVLITLLPAWSFTRENDAATGYAELVARKAAPGES